MSIPNTSCAKKANCIGALCQMYRIKVKPAKKCNFLKAMVRFLFFAIYSVAFLLLLASAMWVAPWWQRLLINTLACAVWICIYKFDTTMMMCRLADQDLAGQAQDALDSVTSGINLSQITPTDNSIMKSVSNLANDMA